jgi:hypothetical protein
LFKEFKSDLKTSREEDTVKSNIRDLKKNSRNEKLLYAKDI